jgi:serine/threonine-protein kinase RsbW
MTANATVHDADIQLRCLSVSENVAIVRELLEGVGDALRLQRTLLNDVKTAASEACNNVVLHAYEEDTPGPLEFDVTVSPRTLELDVRDEGRGMAPTPGASDDLISGLGLTMINSFADTAELIQRSGRGMQMRMAFTVPALATSVRHMALTGGEAPTELTQGDVTLAVVHGPLVGPVLVRVVAMMAVRARFTIDRLSDAQLLGGLVAARAAQAAAADRLMVAFETAPRELELRLGPLRPGGASQLLGGPDGLEPLIGRLVDDLRVLPSHRGELLVARMTDQP